jgi:hypothetical protein
MTVGHEYSLEVIELGANVRRFKSHGVSSEGHSADCFSAHFVNGQPLLAAVG